MISVRTLPTLWQSVRSIALPALITIATLFGFAALSIGQAAGGVVTVTSTGDFTDSNPSVTSLREAIQDANSGACPAPCTIQFSTPGTFSVFSALPSITANGVTIDGFTAPGAIPNSNPFGAASNASLTVVITTTAGALPGLQANAQNLTLQGVVINGTFSTGISLNSTGGTVKGCYIGTNAAGTSTFAPPIGIAIVGSTNTVGGALPADRMLISGSGTAGISIDGNGNNVLESYIGTQADPNAGALGNGTGVLFGSTASNNRVGVTAGEVAGVTGPQGNVISGNSGHGVTVAGTGNRVAYSRIGTNGLGTAALPNGTNGVDVTGSSHQLLMNLVSGNGGNGIHLGAGAISGTLRGNDVGITVSGTALPNQGGIGILLDGGADGNQIGDSCCAPNRIGGQSTGISVSGFTTQGNRITWTEIGNPVANGIGIEVAGAPNTWIYGGNVIVSNTKGIVVDTERATIIMGNTIANNASIGIDLLATGRTAVIGAGPTANDTGDADIGGGNDFQNYPTINSAIGGSSGSANVSVDSSAVSTTLGLRVEIFKADSSGTQGQTLVASQCFAGNTITNQTIPLTGVVAGDTLVGTATSFSDATCATPNDGTSEFSAPAVAINVAPVANADAYGTAEDVALTVAAPGVLSNDADANGDPLAAAVVAGPANGFLTLGVDGSFTYTPNPNFFGTDTFTYTASDGLASSAAATVTITVNAVNDPPVANADSYATNEDVELVVVPPGVLANDTDVEGTSLTASLVSGTASGMLAFAGNGSFTYTPKANFNGTDSFVYAASDGTDVSSPATVTINVAAVNDAPVASSDAATTPEDVAVTVAVLANDSDPDGTTPSISGNTAAANGVVSCSVSNCTYIPNANVNGTDSFTYTITDGSLTSTATVTITVTPVNDAPVAGADSASTTADTPVTINVLANDADIDSGTLTVIGSTNGVNGTVSCTAAGACTYTPSGIAGTDTFTYTVSDGAGGTATGTVTVNVTALPCPGPVTATAPLSGEVVGQTGTLMWTGGAGADLFKIYLGTATSSCTTLFGSTTGTSMSFSGLAPGQYAWKVVAEKSGCSTPPQSSCIFFTVADPCPNAAPTLVSPGLNEESAPEVTFTWTTVENALKYHVVIFTPTAGLQEVALVAQPTTPLPSTLSATATVPLGTISWWVTADFPGGCPSESSANRIFTVVPGCPTGAPNPIAPLETASIGESPVLFQWSPVEDAVRYELFLSINGAPFALAGTVDGDVVAPSLGAEVPAGATLAWRVDAIFPEGCASSSSRVVQVNVGCFPPVLSIPGEVTTEKPYEVRATIVSTGARYLFQESDTEGFTTVLDEKEGVVDPTGEYVAALFEHAETAPRAYFYRVRLDQQGCEFSGVGRIVVVPLPAPTAAEAETVVQFGNEEEIRQSLFIPSPTPELPTSYTFVATTDRDWMRVEPVAGTIGPSGITVTVITNPVGLPVGSNTGTVTLTFTAVAGGKHALETTPPTGSKPVSVTLVTPVTNKGKDTPRDDSLIVPAVAHASGVNSEWQTDLRLLNLGTDKLKYALNLTVSGQDGTITGKSSQIELASGQNTALNDVVKQWYGLGSLPGEGATGVLEIRPLGPAGAGKGPLAVPVTRSLVSLASSRTYNKTPNGTLGEYIPAIPFASFVDGSTPEQGKKSVLSLQQLAQSPDYRTNLGVVEASGQPVNVEIRFYDAEGVKLLTVPVSLQPGEHRQLNQVLAANNLTNVTNARAEVEVVSGDGRIQAYASVVDNVTGDPLQVAAVDLAKIGARKYVMPGVAHFNTGLARWRTDVQMFNAGVASVSAKLDFYPVGATVPSRTATVEVGPGKIRTLSDIVPTLFGQSNTGGAVQISTATSSELVISGRTYDQRDEGSYGQFMAAVTEDDAIGLGDRTVQVLQMEESKDIRSNLGIVEVSGKEARVEVTAFPAESRVTPTAQFTLKANEFRQFNAVLKSLNAGTTYNARVALRVIGGEGKIVAYGSAVDNLTQDPTYIPGQ